MKNHLPRKSHLNRRLIALAVASCFAAGLAFANPTAPTVVNGSASILQSGNLLQITNSPNAIINWGSFSIGAAEITRFIQQSQASAVLNRVIGQDPSSILGALQSNGRVFLINPNGILFGAGAQIDVAGLVASSLNLSNADFLAGRLRFTEVPGAGSLLNQGNITTQQGGNVYLVAPNITNSGIITSPKGEVVLAAGKSVELVNPGTPNLRVEITAPDNEARNLGQIVADSGRIGIYAGLINHSGTIRADSVVVGENGQILLKATKDVTLEAGSVTSANGPSGGAISIEAQDGLLRTTGTIQANGLGSPPSEGGVAATADGVVEGKGGTIAINAAWAGLGGTISADGATQGGTIDVTAGGLSLADRVSATSLSGRGGDISMNVVGKSWETSTSVVDASGASGGTITHIAGQQITTSGNYLATGSIGTGGRIDITAPATKLLSTQIDASGLTAGGSVRIGGEYQGGKNLAIDELPNAQLLAVNDGVRIRADGKAESGAGGSVVLWADQKAAVYGDVSAAPGPTGAGGSIEISSGDKLTFGGMASAGPGGTVLFDPKNVTIGPATGTSQFALVLGYNYNDIAGIDGANLDASDGFGQSVALSGSGSRLAVGASGDAGAGNSTGANTGAVHLFTFTDTNFSGGALAGTIGKGYSGGKNLNVSNLEAGDFFGVAVALNSAGDRLAAGAHQDAGFGNSSGSGTGAVYLFTFTDTSFSGGALAATIGKGYTGGQNVDVSSLEAGDAFGRGVALNAAGDRLAVGAVGDAGPSNLAATGAVHLFTFSDTNFSGGTLAATIGNGYTGGKNVSVSGLDVGDQFGQSVALNGAGDRLAVGAPGDDHFSNLVPGSNSGAVRLFTFTDTSFSGGALAATIGKDYTGGNNFNFSSASVSDELGTGVALNALGDKLAVGARGDQGASGSGSFVGAVHLFTFSDTSFSGATLAGTIGKGYTGGKNVDVASLENLDQFGFSVALNGAGDRIAVGATGDDGVGNLTSSSGAVRLLTFSDTNFSSGTLAATIGQGYTGGKNLNVSSLEAGDFFGVAVALNATGDRLAVGAIQDDGAGNLVTNSGAVHLFTFTDTNFSGGTLAATIGKGYTGGKNVDVASLEASDQFGFGVALNAAGDRLAVGANLDDGAGNAATDSGAVHLFTFTDTNFSGGTLAATIGKGYTGGKNVDVTSLDSSDLFGQAVALNAAGDRLAVGAIRDAGAGNLVTDSGAVHLFTFTDTSFSGGALAATIGKSYTGGKNVDVSSLESSDLFGSAVALNATGDRLAVGAYADAGAGNVASFSGAVRLFTFTDTSFTGGTLAATIGKGYTGGNNVDVASLESGDQFGIAVAMNATGDRLAVGANFDAGAGNATSFSGAVHLFTFSDSSFSGGTLAATIGKGYTGGQNVNVASLEAFDQFGTAVALNASGDRLAVGAYADDGAGNVAGNSGAVYFFNLAAGNPVASATFASDAGLNYTITPASITAITNTGSSVVLQANNDIMLAASSPITTSAGGAGGAITMQAGRSIVLNSNITTDNGNLTVTANDPAAQAANRDSSAGGITMAAGTTLNAGTGTVTLTVGTGVTGAQSGNLVVESIIAANVNLQQSGSTSGSSININAPVTAGGNVTLSASGALSDIDIGASGGISTTGAATATLTAGHDVVLRGAIAATSGSLGLTLNAGNLVRTPSGATLTLDGGTGGMTTTVNDGKTWQNDGTITLQGASTIRLPNVGGYATFSNAASGVLNVNSTAGWSFTSDPSVQGGIVNNAGTININNNTSWEAAFTNASTGNLNIAASKLLSMQNGQSIAGTVDIGSGGTLWVSERHGTNAAFNATTINGTGTLQVVGGAGPVADFTNVNASAATLLVGGGGTANILSGTSTFGALSMGGGTLTGTGTISGNVDNSAGTVAPGASPGILTINGNYAQGPLGTLAVEIGGTTAGSQYDQLVVTGSTTLGGTLTTTLSFVPAASDTFTIIQSSGPVSGAFATTNLSGLSLATSGTISGTNVSLTAPALVSVASSAALPPPDVIAAINTVVAATNTVITATNESIAVPTPEQTLTIDSSDPTTGDNTSITTIMSTAFELTSMVGHFLTTGDNTSITTIMSTPIDVKTEDKDGKEEGNKPLSKGLELQCK